MQGLSNLISLQKSQWDKGTKLAQKRDLRLRRLVRHAYQNVEYFRRLFDSHGLTPDDISGADDLHLIPVTSKRDLQDHSLAEITAANRDISSCRKSRTSGATGVPLTVVGDRSDCSFMNPSFMRAYIAWGLRPWHRLMFFEYRPELSYGHSWYQRLRLFQSQFLSMQDKPEIWIEQILKWRPQLLQGYALTLKLLAEAVRNKGQKVTIPLIVNTSGWLDEAGRELLESVFQAKVIDIYAAEEAGAVIAWQCPSCVEYHICTDTTIVEFLQDGVPVQDGEEGDVIITNLNNYTMPFIRYALGDRAVPSTKEPGCGRSLPLMASISGRKGDFVLLPSGKKLSPHPFFRVLDDVAGVAAWRLIQRHKQDIRIEVESTRLWSESARERIHAEVQQLVGSDVSVGVETVDKLRRNPYEKLRSVVSLTSANNTMLRNNELNSGSGATHETPRKSSRPMPEAMHDDLMQISYIHTSPSLQEVERLLGKAKSDSLEFAEINSLINGIYSPDFPRIKELVLQASTDLRQRLVGNKVITMAPVEVSNYCTSDCTFCGWRSSNRAMERTRISEALILEQVRYLLKKGIYYIELVGGDDIRFVRSILPSLIKSIRSLASEMGVPVKICFCTMALAAKHYRELKEAGADSMIVWQETYDPKCYQNYVIGGPKAHGITDDWRVESGGDGYAFRLHSQERALEAGLEVAIGTILGLNENINFEILSTINHARFLRDRYPINAAHPLIIGMPTWNSITTSVTDYRTDSIERIDPYFSYIASIYLLSMPFNDTWIFPNCRVDFDTQIEGIRAAGVFTSTEVKLGPGGYLPALLAEMKERGESTKELDAVIREDFGEKYTDAEEFQRSLDKEEQFLHFYDTHEAYVEKFSQAGLEIVHSL
jgi:2-iminoacetate synthase